MLSSYKRLTLQFGFCTACHVVELYKFIAYIPLLNQIFCNKNKNGSLKARFTDYIIYKPLWKGTQLFFMIRIIDICDIPLHSYFVSDDNNSSPYAITWIFQQWFYTSLEPILCFLCQVYAGQENKTKNINLTFSKTDRTIKNYFLKNVDIKKTDSV